MPASELAVYVHWPFCLKKCPYCDFNSHVVPSVDQERWRQALLAEMSYFTGGTGGRRVGSIFFGGGTPSLMPTATVAAVIDHVAALWSLSSEAEITLEANPGAVEAARFRDFRAAGVNRLSVGVQALDDLVLRRLGRIHGLAEALAAIALAQDVFPRMSFDLIYARPGQTLADWRGELALALTLAADHLSLYQLSIEKGTAFASQYDRGTLILPDDDAAAALFEMTEEMTAAAGLPAYEISNHARVGEMSRHNLTYWQGGDYVGIGPGAHGRLTGLGGTEAIVQVQAPMAWLDQVMERGHGTASRLLLTSAERATEVVMMGLRLSDGIRRDCFYNLTGAALEAVLDPVAMASLVDFGLLVVDAVGVRTTSRGRLVLNTILARLLS